jgi:hypothetical protein
MKINRQPSGMLLRIDKACNSISDVDPAVGYELAAIRLSPVLNSRCKMEGTPAFREAMVTAIGRILNSNSRLEGMPRL